MSKFAIIHNLDQLTEAQRQQYLRDVSVYIGLDPDLNALDLIWLNTDEGLRRLTAYARRGTTDILREIHGITVSSLDQHDGPGYVSFKATGQNKAGRQEIAIGATVLEGLKGDRIAAGVATAQTRALRRLTLQFVGLAVLDESEVNAFPSAESQRVAQGIINARLDQLTLSPQPTVQPSNEPGKDITLPQRVEQAVVNARIDEVTLGITGGPAIEPQEQFEARQAKLRADAIAKLNAEAGVEPTHNAPAVDIPQKKARKPRGPNKPKVNLGPSAPVPAAQVAAKPEPVVAAPAEQATAAPATPPAVVLAAPPPATVIPSKPRLTPDQVKPFRQRLFRLVNDSLEPAGFAPKEGMGNADKMRSLAQFMFSDVQNMNDLTEAQWDRYLTTLETKIRAVGAADTIKYIEESIGI